jgi:hypothetical protein
LIVTSEVKLKPKNRQKVRKEVTICFRTDVGLRNSLKEIADGDKRSLSSLIETLILGHLDRKTELAQLGIERERRRWKRTDVAIPAFITRCGPEAATFPATIRNVSLGGLMIDMPKDAVKEFNASSGPPPFEALFALPQNQRPLRVQCSPAGFREESDNYKVGAAFADASFHDYQALQTYVMQVA